MADITEQVIEGLKKWGKGINLQSNFIKPKDINNFVRFKILKYKAYNF